MKHLAPLLAAALPLVAACPMTMPADAGSSAEAGDEGGACFPNGTCNGALECVADTCEQPPQSQVGDEGGACFANGTCNGALACVTGVCTSQGGDGGAGPIAGDEGGPCFGNGTCSGALECVDDLCTSGGGGDPGDEGGPCFGNGTCNAGLECVEDLCASPSGGPGELGGPCFGNGTCNAGLECEADTCVEVADLPVINSFTAAPAEVFEGEASTLVWSAAGATSCSLAPGAGPVPTTSTTMVTPTETTTYTLTCENDDGAVEATAEVGVIGLPAIETFMADQTTIDFGDSATLEWTATDVDECELSDGSASTSHGATDSTVVSPETDTTYTLTCSSPGAVASEMLTITVNPPVTIDTFTVDDDDPSLASYRYSETAELAWSSSNATACTLDLDGDGPGLPQAVLPTDSLTTPPLLEDADVVLSCSGVAGPAVEMHTLPVADPVTYSLDGAATGTFLQTVTLTITTSGVSDCTLTYGGEVVFGPQEVDGMLGVDVDLDADIETLGDLPVTEDIELACSNSDHAPETLTVDISESVFDGNLTIADATGVADAADYNRVTGNITVDGTTLTSLILPRLVEVEGTLTVQNNPSLAVASFSRLQAAGQLAVTNDPSLSQLDLPELVGVLGVFQLSNLDALLSFEATSLVGTQDFLVGDSPSGCHDWRFPELLSTADSTIQDVGLANDPDVMFPVYAQVLGVLNVHNVNWTQAQFDDFIDGMFIQGEFGGGLPYYTSGLDAQTDCP